MLKKSLIISVISLCTISPNVLAEYAYSLDKKKLFVGIGYNKVSPGTDSVIRTDIPNGKSVTDSSGNNPSHISLSSSQSIEKNLDGISLYAGYNLNSHVSFQVEYLNLGSHSKSTQSSGYYWDIAQTQNVGAQTKSKLSLFSVDAMLKHRMAEEVKSLEVVVLTGLSNIMSETEINYTNNGNLTGEQYKTSDNNLAWNIGVGVEFDIYKNTKLRLLGKKHIFLSQGKVYKNINRFELSTNYNF
jgi:opacity protein-like surface antigen